MKFLKIGKNWSFFVQLVFRFHFHIDVNNNSSVFQHHILLQLLECQHEISCQHQDIISAGIYLTDGQQYINMRFSPLKKKVKTYNNRQQIHLNKTDGYDDDFAWIYSTKEQQDMIDHIKELEINNAALVSDNESKDAIINELKDNQDAAINDFKTIFIQEHQDRIDDYQSKIDKYQSDIKSKDDEIMSLKAALIDVSGKYNMLRLAVNNTSRLDVLFNRHKDLLNQYPEYHIETDDKSIMIESSDDDNE